MNATLTHSRRLQAAFKGRLHRLRPSLSLFTLLILFPALALAQSPFDTGFTAIQTLFTGTVAIVASLIAVVVGGYRPTVRIRVELSHCDLGNSNGLFTAWGHFEFPNAL